MNKVLKVIAFVVIIAGLIFGGYKLFFEKQVNDETEIIKAEETQSTEENDKKEAALPVKALKIQRGNLPLRLNISATADVWEKAVLRAEINGTVEKINASVGDRVKKAQVLVKLDDVERTLEVDQREAEKLRCYSNYLVKEDTDIIEADEMTNGQKKELAESKRKYQDALKDLERKKIDKKAFEEISAEYQKALIFSGDIREEVRKAQEGLTTATIGLEQAKLNLARTSIRTPFNGKVAELNISKGEKVSAGQELIKVVNLETLYLKGFALESEIANLEVGKGVRIKFDSYPDDYFYGEIQAISPEIDAERKTITVYVKVDNRDHRFLPGMHAEIDVEYQVFENVIKIPREAIRFRQDRYLVFVVRDIQGNIGTANWEYVDLGHQNDEEVEILSGVQEGDLILIEGHATLAHQSRVKIVK